MHGLPRVSSDGLNGNAFAVAKSKAGKVGDGKNGGGDKSSDHLGFTGGVERTAGQVGAERGN
jgi:hypothetical protein